MSAAYWAGVATTPAAAAALAALVVAYARTVAALDRRWGITFDVKARRRIDRITDYVLRHNIWWERAFGPVFVGGWYRETYLQGTKRRCVNRWIGFGSPYGPCFVVYRSWDLGPVEPDEQA